MRTDIFKNNKKKNGTNNSYYKLEKYIYMKKLHKCCVSSRLEKEK